VIFQDFPGPGFFKKKNPGLSRRRGNPADLSSNVSSPSYQTKTGETIIVVLV